MRKIGGWGSWRSLAVCASLALLVVLAYWGVQGNGFVFDDEEYIVLNQPVRGGLTAGGVRWAWTSFYMSNWHPLTWISHLLDVQLFGLDPRGHHLVNVFFHGLNTVLLFVLLRSLTGALWRSAMVAALFGLHPLHVESVAWVAERKDLLSTFFGLLAIGAYAVYARRGGAFSYAASLVLFAAGLLAKPMLVTLPFVLLLLDFWPLGRTASGAPGGRGGDLRRALFLVREKVPFLALSAASSVVTYIAQRETGAVTDLVSYPLWVRLLNALAAYGAYIRKMFWPVDLAAYYPHPGTSLSVGGALAAGLVLAGLTAAALLVRRRRPYAATGWLLYLGTLVPVIGLVQVGEQSMADRYTYLPLTGLFIALVWFVEELLRGWSAKRYVLPAAAAVLLAAATLLTVRQVSYWRDRITLFSRTVEVVPDNPMARYNLAVALTEAGREEEAIPHFLEAARLDPRHENARNNLGLLFATRGDLERAVQFYNEALRINPDHAEAHNNLAAALMALGRANEAIFHYRRSFQLKPEYRAEVRFEMGDKALRRGAYDEAIGHFGQALQLKSDYADARLGLGLAYLGAGRIEEALAQHESLRGLDREKARILLEAIRGAPARP